MWDHSSCDSVGLGLIVAELLSLFGQDNSTFMHMATPNALHSLVWQYVTSDEGCRYFNFHGILVICLYACLFVRQDNSFIDM